MKNFSSYSYSSADSTLVQTRRNEFEHKNANTKLVKATAIVTYDSTKNQSAPSLVKSQLAEEVDDDEETKPNGSMRLAFNPFEDLETVNKK